MAKTNEQVAHASLVSGEETGLHGHGNPKLNACNAPDGAVNFNKKQAVALVIENRTSDPPSPVNGQIWLRTDL